MNVREYFEVDNSFSVCPVFDRPPFVCLSDVTCISWHPSTHDCLLTVFVLNTFILVGVQYLYLVYPYMCVCALIPCKYSL